MKKCRNCQVKFEPRFSSLEKYCWAPECKTIEAMNKLDDLKRLEAKNWKVRKSEMKKANKTASDYRNELQKVFNHWVRLRDRDEGCISCKAPLHNKFDAGHYHSVGNYPNLRFHVDNVHGQCVHCNRDRGGNLIEYRMNLIERIGIDRVNDLYNARNKPSKYSTQEIIDLTNHYKRLIKIFLTASELY
jgi:hypothetical protein